MKYRALIITARLSQRAATAAFNGGPHAASVGEQSCRTQMWAGCFPPAVLLRRCDEATLRHMRAHAHAHLPTLYCSPFLRKAINHRGNGKQVSLKVQRSVHVRKEQIFKCFHVRMERQEHAGHVARTSSVKVPWFKIFTAKTVCSFLSSAQIH